MVQYHISNILSLLKDHIKPNNPHHDALEAEYVAWIDEASFLTEEHKKAWKRAELPLLMSRTFPEIDKDHLKVTLEYMMAFLMLEQLTDTPATTEVAQKWAHVFLLAWDQKLDDPQGPGKVIKMLVYRVLKAVDPRFHSALIASNVRLAKGVVAEASDRENPTHGTSITSYMEARRQSIGLQPFLDLARWAWDLDIQPDIMTHPTVIKLEDLTVDMVSLANDLYSYKKEYYESQAHHNFVTVAMLDPSTPVPSNDRQAAIDYTCQQFTDLWNEFVRVRDQLPSFDEKTDVMMQRYVVVMMNAIVGNIQWSLACKRYGHFESAAAHGLEWGEVIFEMDPL